MKSITRKEIYVLSFFSKEYSTNIFVQKLFWSALLLNPSQKYLFQKIPDKIVISFFDRFIIKKEVSRYSFVYDS